MASSENSNSGQVGNLLSALDPITTSAMVYAHLLHPSNLHHAAIIEFATQFAITNCKGTRIPTEDQVEKYLVDTGRRYKQTVNEPADILSHSFASHRLFMRYDGTSDQEIEATWKRFEQHDSYLESHLGFNVSNALFFAMRILGSISDDMAPIKPLSAVKLSKMQYYDTGCIQPVPSYIIDAWKSATLFSTSKLVAGLPENLTGKMKAYLNACTCDLEELPQTLGPNEHSTLFERPFVEVPDGLFVPIPPYLIHYLSLRLHHVLWDDPAYRGRYKSTKGSPLEEMVGNLLAQKFSFERVFRNVSYRHAGRQGQADIILELDDYLVFFECTTKQISENSWQGESSAIRNDLDKSVRKCFMQGIRAKEAFKGGSLGIRTKGNPRKFMIMVVTDALFPSMSLDEIRGAYLKDLSKGEDYPYVVSFHDLEFIVDSVDATTFLRFLEERRVMARDYHIICADESDYLKLFLKPEYVKIREAVRQRKINLIYTGRSGLSDRQSSLRPIHVIINVLGADIFHMIEVDGPYSKDAVEFAMAFLYEAYNNSDDVLPHFVFDLAGFTAAVKQCKENGSKCRAIAWEGMREYLSRVHSKESELFKQRLSDGSMRTDVNILISIPTDMYDRKTVIANHP